MSVRKNITKETHLKKEVGGGRKEGAGREGNTYLGIRTHPFVSNLKAQIIRGSITWYGG